MKEATPHRENVNEEGFSNDRFLSKFDIYRSSGNYSEFYLKDKEQSIVYVLKDTLKNRQDFIVSCYIRDYDEDSKTKYHQIINALHGSDSSENKQFSILSLNQIGGNTKFLICDKLIELTNNLERINGDCLEIGFEKSLILGKWVSECLPKFSFKFNKNNTGCYIDFEYPNSCPTEFKFDYTFLGKILKVHEYCDSCKSAYTNYIYTIEIHNNLLYMKLEAWMESGSMNWHFEKYPHWMIFHKSN